MIDYFLADDLSGALDAAAAFRHAGRRVRVVLSADAWRVTIDDDVIGVTTETRNAAPAAAASVVARAVEHGYGQGGRLVYKKIDSTLRGPVAAELAALEAALPGVRVLFTPANPAVGRTVRGGVLLVHDVPLAETEFACDPLSPVKESVIRRLLGEAATARVTIADASTDADLVSAVAEMNAAGGEWVGVGSGALARFVAAAVSGNRRRRGGGRGQGAGDRGRGAGDWGPVSCPPSPDLPRPCLLICGSAHRVNREQAAVLARERGVAVNELRSGAMAPLVAGAAASIRAAHGASILVEQQRRSDSGEVVRAVASAAAQIVAATGVRRVFVTGGETAFAMCAALGISALGFCAELESGLSLSRAETPVGSMLFAIKPGGFGDTHTWIRAWDALRAAPIGEYFPDDA